MITNKKKFTIKNLIKTTILWIIGLIWFLPIVGIFVASIRPSEELVDGWWKLRPLTIQFSNYIQVLFNANIPLGKPILNSLFISIIGTLVTLILGSLTGYGLSRFNIPLKAQIIIMLLSTMSVPSQMLIIPVFKIMNSLALIDTVFSVMIMHIVTALPWISFFIMNFMKTQAISLEEAGRIDGCSHIQVFYLIVFPNLYPALLAVFALQFVWSWLDFFFPLIFLYSSQNYTAVQVIPLLRGHFVANWGDLSAASIVVIFFPFLVFFFLQKYYVMSAAGWGGDK